MFGFVRPAACRSSAPRSVTDGCPYPPLPRRAKNRNKIQLFSHRKQEISENGGDFFLRSTNSFHRPRGGPPPSRREVFGVENRRSVECRRARNAFTPSTATAVPLPQGGRSEGFAGQGLRPCRRLHIGALRSPLSPFARPLEAFYTTPGAGSQPCSFQWGLWGS